MPHDPFPPIPVGTSYQIPHTEISVTLLKFETGRAALRDYYGVGGDDERTVDERTVEVRIAEVFIDVGPNVGCELSTTFEHGPDERTFYVGFPNRDKSPAGFSPVADAFRATKFLGQATGLQLQVSIQVQRERVPSYRDGLNPIRRP
jgi:hypothetical protein